MIELMKNMEEPEQAERFTIRNRRNRSAIRNRRNRSAIRNRQLLWKKRKGSCQSMIRSRQRS